MSIPEFDWYGDDTIVVQEQLAVAVYTNPRGNVVIRQKADWCDEDDIWIVISPDRAGAVARAILALVEPEAEPAPLALPAPADRTAAERQKRYRQRHRNGVTPVTDTVTATSRNGPELFGHPPD